MTMMSQQIVITSIPSRCPGTRRILEACLPIVDVPVHIVTGMPMTVGMGMRMAITMGTRKYIIGIAYGYSHGHAHYILAVPMTLSMGTL